MTAPVVVAWARARWPWVAGVLVLVLIFFGAWYYGSTQYNRGRDLARADIADSIGRVYERRYTAFSDSTRNEIAAFKSGLAAANARADAADLRAVRAQAQAANLTPQIIARTPPEVLAALASVRMALDTTLASNREMRVELAHSDSLLSRAVISLTLADTTIAAQGRTIAALRKVKDPPHGFWHTAGMVAKFTGAAVVGGIIGALSF